MSKEILYTSQIYLRPISSVDIDNGWLEWINDNELTKFLVKGKYTREDLIKYVEDTNSSRMFAVCLLENDRYIGNARLSKIDWINRRAAYGRLVGVKNLSGRNIGTEILALLAYFAFNVLDLHRIHTGVISKNIASIKSNDKFGAVREGIFRESIYLDGNYEDIVRFGILKKDFINSKWQKIISRK